MKKSVKKAITASLAGVTILNSMPIEVLAESKDNGIISDSEMDKDDVVIDIEGYDTSIEFEEGGAYFDKDSGKLYMGRNSIIKVNADKKSSSKELVEIRLDSKKLEENKFVAKDINYSSLLEFVFSDGSSSTVSLLTYLTKEYGAIMDIKVSSVDDKFKLIESGSCCGSVYAGYYLGMEFYCTFSIVKDKDIPLEAYGFSAKFGDMDIPSKYISLNEDETRLTVHFDLDDEEFQNLEGNYKFEVSVGENLTEGAKHSNTYLIDTKMPELSVEPEKLVEDSNGVQYVGLDEDGNVPVKIKVKDSGVGTKGGISLTIDGEEKKISTGEEGVYEVSKTLSKEELLSDDKIAVTILGTGQSSEGTYNELSDVDFSKVVFGIPETDITASLTGDFTNNGDWYSGDVNYSVQASSDLGIEKVEYDISGIQSSVEVDGEKQYSAEVPVSEKALEDGTVDFKVKVTTVGGEVKEYSDTIKVDNVNPTIEGIGTSLDWDSFHVYGDTAYLTEAFSLKGVATDKASGIKSVEVFKDGNKVSDSLDYTVESSGTYSVKLTDNAGNVSEYTLGDFADLTFSSVIISDYTPSINDISIGGDSQLINDKTWYSSLGNLNFSIDGEYLENLFVKVDTKYLYDGKGESKDYSISLDDLDDGYHKLTITVLSRNGKSDKYTVDFRVDRTKPELLDMETETGMWLDNKIWFSTNPVLRVQGTDSYSGVAKYILIDENGKETSAEDGVFTLESGTYKVQVEDVLGNRSEAVALGDYFKWGTNTIVVDTDKPEIDLVTPETPVKDVYGDDVYFSANLADLNGIKSYKITLNDKTLDEKSYTSDIPSYETVDFSVKKNTSDTNEYNLVIEVVDGAGNKSEKEYSFKIDTEAPDIKDIVLNGKFNDYGDSLWFNEEPSIEIKAEDTLANIDYYEVLNKDGTITKNKTGNFTLKSGDYSVRVTDIFGNSKEVTFKEQWGTSGSVVTIDDGKPEIACVRPEGDLDGWYQEDVEYRANISDNKGIKKAYLEVNGTIVDEYNGGDTEYTLVGGTESVDSKENYEYTVKVYVEDYSGNSNTWSDTIKVDKDSPTLLDGSVLNNITNSDDNAVYSTKKLHMELKAEDVGVGLDKYVLKNLDTDEVIESSDGVFDLGNGSYTVSLVDKLGNTSKEVPIKDIFKLSSNTVIVDNEEPMIRYKQPEGDVDGWYAEDVTYSIDVKDSIYLKNANVYINGVLVDSYESSSVDTDTHTLKADTSKVEAEDGYKYTIKVDAEDFAGNTSTMEEVVYVDKQSPEFKDCSLSQNKLNVEYGVFFSDNPTLNLKSDDNNGVGVDKYYLYDKEGNVVENTTGIFTLDSNEYFVQVGDKLGNLSDKVSLKDLLGLNSNSIVVDRVNPSISAVRPSGDINGWFNKDIVYNIDLTDNVGIYSAKVSINGVTVDEIKPGKGGIIESSLKADTSKVEPNKDGSYTVNVELTDNAGNKDSWSDVVYIDRTAPTVDKFVITAEGYKEGSDSKGSDEYGFYISGATDVEVYVSDGDVSSGMSELHYTLKTSDGKEEKGVAKIENGVAKVSLPNNFKGFISAYAVDNVGNKGSENKPDGIISEDGNVHVNNSSINIKLPSTEYTDNSGHSLYNSNITVESVISNNYSGIRKIEWGLDDKTLGTVSVDNKGNVTGDVADILSKDKNLILSLTKYLGISSNKNGINVWVKTTDRVGNVSESNRVISIDKDKPVIKVSYDNSNGSNYYAGNRVATVSITERNFKASDVKFEGSYGVLGSWTNVGGDTWVNTVTFNKDGDYKWSVNYTDLAGNKAEAYNSESFTVDKTAPVMSVAFDNNNVLNGNFYKNNRTATVTIVEHNFDPSLVKLTGNGSLSNWSSNGDKHTATITFDKDGEYEFALTSTDKAGNASNSYSSGKFIIDKTIPNVEVLGVQNGVSYKKNTLLAVKVSDEYIDGNISSVTLRGRTVGDMKLDGKFNEKTGEFVFTGVPNDAKYDDLYTLTVKAYDKAGNLNEKVVQFSINRYGSSYNFTQEGILSSVLRVPQDISIQEVSVDRLDTKKVKIVVIRDGEEIPVDESMITIKESGGVDEPWVYDYLISKEVFDKDGKYTVQIYSMAEDGTGNSSLSQEYSFIIDTTKPEIIVSGVETNGSYNDVSRKVSIDVRDLSGVKSIDVKLNGKPVELTEDNGMYNLVVDENSEEQNLVVTVLDNADNENTVEVKNFLITSSVVRTLFHQSWVKVVLAGIAGVVALLIGVLLKRRKDAKEEELKVAEENAKMYRDSSTGGSDSSEKENTSEE